MKRLFLLLSVGLAMLMIPAVEGQPVPTFPDTPVGNLLKQATAKLAAKNYMEAQGRFRSGAGFGGGRAGRLVEPRCSDSSRRSGGV